MKYRILLFSLCLLIGAATMDAQTKPTNEKIFSLGIIRELQSKRIE